MTILEQAYHELGADYELGEALAAQDVKAAFMAAHTLKGVCQNLGFDNLYAPSSELTEVLRAGSLEGADELYAKVAAEYHRTEEVLKPCL